MNDEERRAKFQLIRKPRRVTLQEEQLTEPATQGLLFPMPKRDLLIFLVFPFVTEDEFTKTLELTKPAAILELRRSPRFDIGHLNRQEAFRWFEAVKTRYYDLSSSPAPDEQQAADPVQLVAAFLSRTGNQVPGPVMILISQGNPEGGADESSVFTQIAKLFASASKHPWETVEIPKFA